jgi:prepilin-type N-terminal cleavage/methylation domain-containing protein
VKSQAGFTLLELMLSMAIITILAVGSIPVYETFVRRNDLDLTTQHITASLRRAQTYARASKEDSAWSVNIQSGTATLFKGTNFGGRDTTKDETVAIPATVTPSGLGEIRFTAFSAAPNTTGTITLTSTTNDARTITINAKGMVAY